MKIDFGSFVWIDDGWKMKAKKERKEKQEKKSRLVKQVEVIKEKGRRLNQYGCLNLECLLIAALFCLGVKFVVTAVP